MTITLAVLSIFVPTTRPRYCAAIFTNLQCEIGQGSRKNNLSTKPYPNSLYMKLAAILKIFSHIGLASFSQQWAELFFIFIFFGVMFAGFDLKKLKYWEDLSWEANSKQ